jgi:hypothetical protein
MVAAHKEQIALPQLSMLGLESQADSQVIAPARRAARFSFDWQTPSAHPPARALGETILVLSDSSVLNS